MPKRKADFWRFENVEIPVEATIVVERKTGKIISKDFKYAHLPLGEVMDCLFTNFGFFGPREIDLPEGSYFVVGVQEREADGRLGPNKMLKRRFEHESLAYEYMRTLKSLLQHHSLKALILWCSAFFMVQLSHSYMTIGK